MAHKEQRDFFEIVRASMPHLFHGVRALDCGSLDVNGSLRDLFDDTTNYIGVDVRAGRNVHLVSVVHQLPLADGWFDTVVSAEMLEHDPYWDLSLRKMHQLLRVGGLLVISTATHGREEHGTDRIPDIVDGQPRNWSANDQNHYRNIDESDVRNAFLGTFEEKFRSYGFGVNEEHHDLYFWGIKR